MLTTAPPRDKWAPAVPTRVPCRAAGCPLAPPCHKTGGGIGGVLVMLSVTPCIPSLLGTTWVGHVPTWGRVNVAGVSFWRLLFLFFFHFISFIFFFIPFPFF